MRDYALVPTFRSYDSSFYSPTPYSLGRQFLGRANLRIADVLANYFHGKISRDTVSDIAKSLSYRPAVVFKKYLKEIRSKYSTYASWRRFIDVIDSEWHEVNLSLIRRLLLAREVPALLTTIQRALSYYFSSSYYVGPARVASERYYRNREIAVDQIDPAGGNFAMFVRSLSIRELASFSSWTEEYLGYRLNPSPLQGHLSLMLSGTDKSEKRYNLVDMGFGLSQILPVLAQMWASTMRSRPSVPLSPDIVLAVEQPELHLHPALQARIADALVRTVTTANPHKKAIYSIVETHSEALINRLGDLVARGAISPDAIAVYIFNKEDVESTTTVQAANFDDSGVLENWPFGFFSPSMHNDF